jgi:two-component system, response regulator PdtaR
VRVLIVEDEAITAMFLAMSLREAGHQVVATTASGEKACALALDHHPEAIIMDIALAGEMDGITAAHTIRLHLEVPIVFASGYTTEEVKDRARAVPNSRFLNKPLEPDSLQALFRTLEATGSMPER